MHNEYDFFSLYSLLGRNVRINRGGPDSRHGRLIAVKSDYLVLQVREEGILYYRTNQIKSITVDTQEDSYLERKDSEVQGRYVNVERFDELLKRMNHHWVQVNRGGHECIRGVLLHEGEDDVSVIINNEIVKINPTHIRNISFAEQLAPIVEENAQTDGALKAVLPTAEQHAENETVSVQQSEKTLVQDSGEKNWQQGMGEPGEERTNDMVKKMSMEQQTERGNGEKTAPDDPRKANSPPFEMDLPSAEEESKENERNTRPYAEPHNEYPSSRKEWKNPLLKRTFLSRKKNPSRKKNRLKKRVYRAKRSPYLKFYKRFQRSQKMKIRLPYVGTVMKAKLKRRKHHRRKWEITRITRINPARAKKWVFSNLWIRDDAKIG
ncbi:hypothetical protein BSNK01_05080 [Bacillaceae bacterium]